jgi:DNA-directed RNA polymerase specialized sigma24 family protein
MPNDTNLVADRHLMDRVARHGSSIYALAYGMLVEPGDAEEAVAETFAHVWRAAARFLATTNQLVSACI